MVEWRGVSQPSSVSLVDVLDKVLDKGLVVVGDISVSLANVELLTIKVRLMLCSIDKATEVGLDWWKHDPFFSSTGPGESRHELQQRIEALEQQVNSRDESPKATPRAPRRRSTQQPDTTQ
ncbi:MAG: gas vesicle protein [Dehalococcoidia bacterium]